MRGSHASIRTDEVFREVYGLLWFTLALILALMLTSGWRALH
jgi:hypothetical protein